MTEVDHAAGHSGADHDDGVACVDLELGALVIAFRYGVFVFLSFAFLFRRTGAKGGFLKLGVTRDEVFRLQVEAVSRKAESGGQVSLRQSGISLFRHFHIEAPVNGVDDKSAKIFVEQPG